MGRVTAGVRGIRLRDGDWVEEVAAFDLNAEVDILVVTDRGYGKRTSAYEYRVSGRGGKGIAAMVTNERNGSLAAAFPIEEGDQIILVTNGGQLIRCPVHDVRIASRNTQGVRIFRTGEDEHVVSVERIPEDATEDDADNGSGDGEANGEPAGDAGGDGLPPSE